MSQTLKCLGRLLGVFGLAAAAFLTPAGPARAQLLYINCDTNIQCTQAGVPSMTKRGDGAPVAFGKVNSDISMLAPTLTFTGTGPYVRSQGAPVFSDGAYFGKPAQIDLTNATNFPSVAYPPCLPYTLLGNNTGSTQAVTCIQSFQIGAITTGAPGNVTINAGGGVFPSSLVFPAMAYGSNGLLVGLGGTACAWGSTGDNMPCIVAAANAACTAGGGNVFLPAITIGFQTLPAFNCSGVQFWGGGEGLVSNASSNATAAATTMLLYDVAGAGIQHNNQAGGAPSVAFYVGQPTQGAVYAAGLHGIGIDCNLGLDIGLEMQQVLSSPSDVVVRRCLEGEVWETTNTGSKADGTQQNVQSFTTFTSGTTANGHTYAPIGVLLDGNGAGSPGWNVSLSTYGTFTVSTCQGDGVWIANVDNISIDEVRVFPGGCSGRQGKVANPSALPSCYYTYYGCPPLSHNVAGRPGHFAAVTIHKTHVGFQVDGFQDGSTWTVGGGNVAQLVTLTGITSADAAAQQNTLVFPSFTASGSGAHPTAPVKGMVANCQYNAGGYGGSGTASFTNTAIVASGGTGAGATATIITNSSGGISSFALTAPGTGYTVGDTLTWAINGGSVTATVQTGETACGVPDNDVVESVTGSGPYNVQLRGEVGASSAISQVVPQGSFIYFTSAFTGTAFYRNTSGTLTPYSVTTNGTTLSVTAPGGAPGGNSQSGVAQSGNCATFLDLVLCWSGTLTSGDTFSAQPSQPQWDVSIGGVDRDNTKPLANFEPGSRGDSYYVGTPKRSYGMNTAVMLGSNTGVALAKGTAIPYTSGIFIGNDVDSLFPINGLNDLIICMNALCDPSTDLSDYVAIGTSGGPLLSITGGATPSTSVATFAGILGATGGILPPPPGNNFAPSEIDLTDVGLNGVQSTNGTGGSGTANYTNVGIMGSGGTGTGVTATITTNGSGNIMAFTLTAAGSGYTIGDPLTFVINGGSATRTVDQLRNPILRWNATGLVGADYGFWECQATGVPSTSSNFNCYSRGHAGATPHNWLSVTDGTGSAETINDVSFGNATDNPTIHFLGNGAVSMGGSLSVGGAIISGSNTLPYVLAQWGVPMLIPPLGAGSNISSTPDLSGFTPGTTTPFTSNPCANGCYMFFPAGSISASNTSNFYYTTCSSTTLCSIFTNKWDPTVNAGPPTKPGSPGSWGTVTGSVTPTQTTATDLPAISIPLPANSLGTNGSFDWAAQVMRGNTANQVSEKMFASTTQGVLGTQLSAATVINTGWYGICRTFRNMGVANAQTIFPQGSNVPCETGSVNATPTLLSVNTGLAQFLTISLNLPTAGTDWIELLGGKIVVSYAP